MLQVEHTGRGEVLLSVQKSLALMWASGLCAAVCHLTGGASHYSEKSCDVFLLSLTGWMVREAGYDTELYNWKLLYKAMGPADVVSIVCGLGGLDT